MKSSTYFPVLTGVRAVAAFLVFFHHFNQSSFPFLLYRVFNEFHIGVTIFFTLSGFLICLRYYDTVEISSNWFKKYIKNRIARIYPMYLLLTLATFIFAYCIGNAGVFNGFPWHWLLILMNVFFIRGFFDDLKFTGLSQGWSLTVEECFYFLAPFFFVQIHKNKRAIWILPILILLTGVLLVTVFSHFNWWGFFGNYTFMFLYTFIGRCTEFFIGIAVAKLILKQENTITTRPLFTSFGVLIMAIAVGLMASVPLTATLHYGLYAPLGIVSNNLVLPIGIGLLFYGLIMEHSILKKILATKTMELLGKSSYIFYLVHIGFIATLLSDNYTKWLEQGYEWLEDSNYSWIAEHIPSGIVMMVLVFISLNLISILLYKTIEEPMNLYIRKSNFLIKAKS